MFGRYRLHIGPSGRLIAAIFAVLAFIALVPLAAEEIKQHSKPYHSAGQQDGAPQAAGPAIVSNSQGARSGQGDKQGVELGSWPDWVIVAFTAFLAWVAWRQHLLGNKLATDTVDALEIARRSADAAKKAADSSAINAEATQQLAVISTDTAQRQLRAYVHVSSADILNPLDPQNRTAKIGFRNFGQTPALNVNTWVASGVMARDAKDERFRRPPPSFRFGSDDMPAGGDPQFNRTPIPETTEVEEEGLHTETCAIWLWGEVTYDDVYRRRWATRFRYFSTGDGVPLGLFRADHRGCEVE